MSEHEWTERSEDLASRLEARLVSRARRGDGDAFATLVTRHDRPLRALAFRLLEDEAAMDDVLQEAYVKAYVGLARFEGGAAFGTWLYRIVYNACLDELRRRGRRPAVALADVAEPEDPRAGDAPDAVIGAADLASALSALAPELRATVLLVDAEGWSYDQAAAVLGVPVGTLASRLNRARALLRPALSSSPGSPA